MKRFLCLFIAVMILSVGCSPAKSIETKSPEVSEQLEEQKELETTEISEQSEGYRTLLSPKNELSIVIKPKEADYSFINPGEMAELPKYDPNTGNMWQVDLRSSDLRNLDLSENINDLLYADFDSKTKWPDKLPDGFDPQMIMELGKNPGLGLRELHKKGITGKGIGLAIIDQTLLVDHVEYKEQLKMYEEIHSFGEDASMHGPAVASLAVGKTVGVAPEANLYYISETDGFYNEKGEFEWDLSWIAKSIDRIVEVNKILPKEEKIRVISISLGIDRSKKGSEKVFESIKKAEQEGIYTVYVGSDQYGGLGREPLKNPDDIASFTKGGYWKNAEYYNDRLLTPMDSRCTASPTGIEDYVFYRQGGMSWSVPYVAGLYALACQVNSDITPHAFWKEAFITGDTISINNNNREKLGKIVNPARLIEKIEKMK